MVTTECIDKLFLELSQVTQAKTIKELELERKLKELEDDREWQIAQNVRMFEVIKETADYLDTNKFTTVTNGSILHQKLRAALEVGR